MVSIAPSKSPTAAMRIELRAGSCLEIKRCPRCLYDLRMTPADTPCPECGYTLKAGAVVAIVPRQPRNRWMLGLSIFVFLIFLLVFAEDLRGGISSFSILAIILIQSVVPEAVRHVRASISNDAYVSELWLTHDGIGFITDADPDTFGKSLEWVTGMLLSLLLLAALWLDSSKNWRMLLGFGVFLAFLGVNNWWRTAAKSKDDRVRPKLFPWHRIKELQIKYKLGGHILIRSPWTFGWFTHFHFTHAIVGDRNLAGDLATLIADYRQGLAVYLDD